MGCVRAFGGHTRLQDAQDGQHESPRTMQCWSGDEEKFRPHVLGLAEEASEIVIVVFPNVRHYMDWTANMTRDDRRVVFFELTEGTKNGDVSDLESSEIGGQTGPSAKDSVIFSGGDSSKNYGADQQRLQISDLHFDKFPTPATFACWKIRFKTEVCTCSQLPTEAMQWIKEVVLVDSVDELRSSSSIRGILMPNFEVLDARIASALNKIIS